MTRILMVDGRPVDVDEPDFKAVARIIEARRAREPYVALGDELLRVVEIQRVVPNFIRRREAA